MESKGHQEWHGVLGPGNTEEGLWDWKTGDKDSRSHQRMELSSNQLLRNAYTFMRILRVMTVGVP